MAPRTYYLIVAIVLLFARGVSAQELVTSFEDKDIPVLNEELRKLRADITSVSSGTSAVSIASGIIVMWSGAIEDIPSGWFLCDGDNDTPDLTDRFVLPADADSGGTNNVGDTGGVDSVTLTTNELPAHTHDIQKYTGDKGSDGVALGGNSADPNKGWIDTTNFLQAKTAGSGAAFSITPKYYALAYIMKQ